MFPVGLMEKWPRIQERLEPKTRIVGRDQAALDAGFLYASKLRRSRS
jgi:hypothetical protein